MSRLIAFALLALASALLRPAHAAVHTPALAALSIPQARP